MKENQKPTAMPAMGLQIVVLGQFDRMYPTDNYTMGGEGGYDNQC